LVSDDRLTVELGTSKNGFRSAGNNKKSAPTAGALERRRLDNKETDAEKPEAKSLAELLAESAQDSE